MTINNYIRKLIKAGTQRCSLRVLCRLFFLTADMHHKTMTTEDNWKCTRLLLRLMSAIYFTASISCTIYLGGQFGCYGAIPVKISSQDTLKEASYYRRYVKKKRKTRFKNVVIVTILL